MKHNFISYILILLLSSCSANTLYSELSELSGTDVIEIGTFNIGGNIGKIFSKYTYVTAVNGGRIEIFGTSKVSNEQMIYARDILKKYLESDGEKYKAVHKKIIANSLANKKSAIVFWDSEKQYEDNISRVSLLGYNVQDLYATESWSSGNRDASYEEILHLVQNYGISPTLFEFQSRIQKANDIALEEGYWNPWDDLPKADFDDEYFAAAMDCFLGLWQGQESTMNGSYKFSSREEMKKGDPLGYQLIIDLFGEIATVR